mmetsp:Transcript_18628/g.33334  ORF Transcript_18628/g.33334 Transcript_18628/m.33334 type:complete len:193 (+) Transcript_18628:1310-1888(+)|eukprot:CAMPEP_0197517678 /NCGR_PEP_ID=MMETSP1318-20131121/2736_1 /TAXON_ID=552666 /ORGANISM="Partenskyella glossopodia, Strain RCC365" /LENGTH=192 /DNA_ID=CAMNT_0043067445 /DNA_START=89 /DNA_END=667 /DNA_ORIENTATION=-
MQNASRIQKELKEVQSEAQAGVSAKLVEGKLNHWKGEIQGPEGTPYEGGNFVVDIKIPENYPFVPPKMRFDTKIWHPNVSSANGAICLDILKDEWSPALTMRTALLSLQALLCDPNPSDPQDAQVAAQYKKNVKEWEATAKFWTQTYAMTEDVDTKVKQLTEMGFPTDKAKAALAKHNGDLNRALNDLFTSA